MPTNNQFSNPALAASYDNLPVFAKTVLQLCSVISEPIGVSTLLKCLYDTDIQTDIARADYAREIHPCLELLQDKKLITGKCQCSADIIEIISRQAVIDNNFTTMSQAVKTILPSIPVSYMSDQSAIKRDLRDLRIALHSHDMTTFHHALITYYRRSARQSGPHPIVKICGRPFAAEWLATFPDHIQFLAIHEILKDHLGLLQPIDDIMDYLEDGIGGQKAPIARHQSFTYLFISSLLLRGELNKAKQAIQTNTSQLTGLGLNGWLHFMQGDMASALTSFNEDISALRQINKDDDAYFTGFEGLLYFLTLMQSDSYGVEIAQKIYTNGQPLQGNKLYRQAYKMLFDVFICRQKQLTCPQLRIVDYTSGQFNSISCLFTGLASYWLEGRLNAKLQKAMTANFELAVASGYDWLAQEFASLLYLDTGENRYRENTQKFQERWQSKPLFDAINHEEPWQRVVRGLNTLINQQTNTVSATKNRLIWLLKIDPENNKITAIIPKEQKISGYGEWSKGHVLALKKLSEPEVFRRLGEQDKKICAAIRGDGGTFRDKNYHFDMEQAIPAMVDHPLVFRDNGRLIKLDISREEPQLRIKNDDRTVAINFSPFPQDNQNLIIRFCPPGRLKVYEITEIKHKIATLIGPNGLRVPEESKDEILDMLGGIAGHLPIYSDFFAPTVNLKTVKPDQRIYYQIIPARGSFNVSMQVKPQGESGLGMKPGMGAKVIIADIDGERLQTIRNHQQEKEKAQTIVDACPTLLSHEDEDWQWFLPELPDCLGFLLEVQALQEEVVIEWPQGENLQIRQKAGVEQLYLKINKHQSWFAINGKIQIDEDHVMEMRQLLDLVKKHNSRFIPLSDNEFLSLTAELYQHLADLNAISNVKDDITQFPQAAAPMLLKLAQGAGRVDYDEHWAALAARIKAAGHYNPCVPSTLNTKLRAYQIDGFTWMSRLAYLGCGACLADEMGLGKTIQALALILDQAANGPCLILAPTSVCHNWAAEIGRYAPTLNCVFLNGSERKKTLDKLKSFDLLITSYGLLQQEVELLTSKQWQVIVLDEAQAIKNMSTKRSKAAMSLKGRFRLITTGTPLENNLGELWNLFQFINPGILGSISAFNRHFAIPIERDKNREVQKRLRKIISPFILRRLKSQVLDDLPPRTEINYHVDLNPAEAALYESLRREALENLNTNERGQNHHMLILAGIMRLRQACCNPAIIQPGLGIKSSKLAIFAQLVDELLLNNHKILVFSQFVSHLTILRDFLDKKKISYKYLDGSTPPKERKKRVESFQAGNGDVFLISLKAGGLGLNLTAANYVIHMDPWWNPAVEDQASDRIHRIGQKRPVTIYRLITRGTIEEKIVALHREKRELADSLLKGSDMSHKISTSELLALLKEEGTMDMTKND
ncbi:MAG: DEAD/DEAH box helicase [Deltaproteobacteria bacterium]|nr:DEAD/DEAH box helicase [Deltaproteobacteria bacterium]